MKKTFNINCSEEQLRYIIEAVDQYGRLACMQFDEWWLWNRIDEVVKSDKQFYNNVDVQEFNDNIRLVQQQHIMTRGASWCASPFVEELYHIQKSLSKAVWDSNNNDNMRGWDYNADGPLLTQESHDKIEVTVNNIIE